VQLGCRVSEGVAGQWRRQMRGRSEEMRGGGVNEGGRAEGMRGGRVNTVGKENNMVNV